MVQFQFRILVEINSLFMNFPFGNLRKETETQEKEFISYPYSHTQWLLNHITCPLQKGVSHCEMISHLLMCLYSDTSCIFMYIDWPDTSTTVYSHTMSYCM